jgi:hypothetical protein
LNLVCFEKKNAALTAHEHLHRPLLGSKPELKFQATARIAPITREEEAFQGLCRQNLSLLNTDYDHRYHKGLGLRRPVA